MTQGFRKPPARGTLPAWVPKSENPQDEGEEEETKPLPRMDTEQLGPPEEEVDAVSDATFSAHVSAGGPSEHESLVDDDAEASFLAAVELDL